MIFHAPGDWDTHTQQKTIHCHQYPLIESICPSLKASFWLVESPLLTIKPPWLMVKSHQKSIKKILFMVQSHYIPVFDDEIHRVSRNSRPSATLKFVGSFAAKSRRIIRRGSQTCRWEPPRAPRAQCLRCTVERTYCTLEIRHLLGPSADFKHRNGLGA